MKIPQVTLLIILLVVGLLIGSIIGEVLGGVVPILAKSQQVTWQPRADFNILKYDLYFQVKLNLASAIGLGVAFWIYRKL